MYLSKIVKSPTLGIPHQIITNVSLCLFFNYSYYFNEMGSNKWCFFFHLILTRKIGLESSLQQFVMYQLRFVCLSFIYLHGAFEYRLPSHRVDAKFRTRCPKWRPYMDDFRLGLWLKWPTSWHFCVCFSSQNIITNDASLSNATSLYHINNSRAMNKLSNYYAWGIRQSKNWLLCALRVKCVRNFDSYLIESSLIVFFIYKLDVCVDLVITRLLIFGFCVF